MPDKPFSISIKILIKSGEGKVLFLKRAEDSGWNPGKWDLPGGKMDLGEILEEALHREVLEETGLKIDIRSLLGAVQDTTRDYRIVHILMIGNSRSGEISLSHEHEDFKWVSPAEMKKLDLCEYLFNFDFSSLM
jgi:8-oxo-dGTP diphosphatase